MIILKMNKRPTCAVPGCKREAFVLLAGKWVCGECYLKYTKQKNEKFWKEIENANA